MIPNYDELIKNASCKEEAKKWEEAKKRGYKPPEGWACGCFRQECGHFEILQHPIYIDDAGNPTITEDEVMKILADDSSKRKCTKCVCGWTWK